MHPAPGLHEELTLPRNEPTGWITLVHRFEPHLGLGRPRRGPYLLGFLIEFAAALSYPFHTSNEV